MASTKTLLPVAILLLLVGFAPHGAEAAGSAPLALITGVVPCSTERSINVAAVPVFPNAGVKVMRGGKEVTRATADHNGAFSINLGHVTTAMLEPILRDEWNLVVITPLAACNVSLADATGTLTAPLQLVGVGAGSSDPVSGLIGLIVQIIGGLLGSIVNIVPSAFSFV